MGPGGEAAERGLGPPALAPVAGGADCGHRPWRRLSGGQPQPRPVRGGVHPSRLSAGRTRRREGEHRHDGGGRSHPADGVRRGGGGDERVAAGQHHHDHARAEPDPGPVPRPAGCPRHHRDRQPRPGRPGRRLGPGLLRFHRGRERLLPRRRQHHKHPIRPAGRGAQLRVHPGGAGHNRRLQRRVWPLDRGRNQRHHQIGRQRVPRRRFWVLGRRRPAVEPRGRRRAGPDLRGEHDRRHHPVGLWRRPRRLPRARPAVVLRGL